MSTFPLLPAGSMYGWLGQALTIVSLPSPTSIRSTETYIPPSEGYITQQRGSNNDQQYVENKAGCIQITESSPDTIGPTVIHWLIVNGVTRAWSRIRSHHNRPTINIWRAVRGGWGHISPIRTTPLDSFVETFILLRTGNSRLRREIVFG